MGSRYSKHDVRIEGQQLRVRINAPYRFNRFYTKEKLGGKVQFVYGHNPRTGNDALQSCRLNLAKIRTEGEARTYLNDFPAGANDKAKARQLLARWYAQ